MSRGGDLIGLEGLRDLKIAFQKSYDEVQKAAMKGYKKAAQNIIVEAQRNLKDNGSIATGVLRRSGKVQEVDDTTIDAGFFSEGEGYAVFAEYGRRSGKFPPMHQLEEWLRKKYSNGRGGNILDLSRRDMDKWRRSTAFLIGRKIAKEGSKPHPFFNPAIQKYKGQITRVLTQAIKQVLG